MYGASCDVLQAVTYKYRTILAVVVVLTIVASIGILSFRNPLTAFLGTSAGDATLLLSGNIEAHESVLSFKTVQSRIVELPFNEGQWVSKGAVLAVVDATDYRQQQAIAEAALAVQQRQLASARQNLATAAVLKDGHVVGVIYAAHLQAALRRATASLRTTSLSR